MIRVKQTEINRCEIVVDFNEVSLDKPVSIHAYMNYNDEPFMLLKRNINPQEIINNKTIISMPSFGKYNFKISDLEENRILYEDVVPVKASRYIIAPLASSTQTLLFMLYYFSDMPVKTKEGDPVPVIITLSRNNHVDYRFLPENMYLNPYITQKDYEIESKRKWPGLETHEYKICYFLNELKEIDNDSSFIFYLNDMDPHLKKDVLGRNVESIFLMDGHMTLLKLKSILWMGIKAGLMQSICGYTKEYQKPAINIRWN